MFVLPMLLLVFMAFNFFSAIKEEKHASIIGLARQLIFYVPAMLILPRLFGIQWVYFGATLIDIIVTIWILLVVMKLFKSMSNNKELNEEKLVSA
jgi:Na+-driven multidrug efflux pump